MIANETKDDSERERWREKKQQENLLIGIADFVEEHSPKLHKAYKQSGHRRRKADLQNQREEQFLLGAEGFHGACVQVSQSARGSKARNDFLMQ